MNVKTLFLTGTLGIALAPSLALARSDIDGTWRVDISRAQFTGNPEVFVLKNGEYQCKSCAPVIVAKADGADHAISGSPYFDTVSFKIVDDHTVEETRKKNGKTVLSSKIVFRRMEIRRPLNLTTSAGQTMAVRSSEVEA